MPRTKRQVLRTLRREWVRLKKRETQLVLRNCPILAREVRSGAAQILAEIERLEADR